MPVSNLIFIILKRRFFFKDEESKSPHILYIIAMVFDISYLYYPYPRESTNALSYHQNNA